VTPVLEEDDEAECEKEKQSDPKQRAQQRHGGTVSYSPDAVNAPVARVKLTLNQPSNLPWFSRMRVPLLDLSEQYSSLAEPIRQRIDEILRTQRFILGPYGTKLEEAFSKFSGAGHAIAVSSGTDALLAVFMGLGLGPGDAVITPAYTFFATAGCVARVGARPLFVDIDPATFNISAQHVADFLRLECQRRNGKVIHRSSGTVVRAVVPVHLFGLCCDMEAIAQIAKEFGLTVVEDAAQAIGAECLFDSRLRQAGTMGRCGCFSFYPSKNLGAAGDAGMITCQDNELATRLRILREHGMEPRYYHHLIGGNFRMDEMQAAILELKLAYLPQWSAGRRSAADFYREEFDRVGLTKLITVPVEPYRNQTENHHIYHQYVIRTPRRDELRDYLQTQSIGCAVYYPLGLHEQPCFSYLGYKRGDLPVTEKAAAETLALPIYPEISRDAQSYVVETIARFLL
jgi:dTDP-4-amino-4,6-dideoxygalactose transaminase